MAGDAGSELSRGGMRTKVEAAKIAVGGGTPMVIASGKVEAPLARIEAGAPCTWFLTTSNPLTARKKWLAGHLEPRGVLHVDAGAATALRGGQASCPPASRASRAPSRAGTRWSSATRRAPRSGAASSPMTSATRCASPGARAAPSRRSWAFAAAPR